MRGGWQAVVGDALHVVAGVENDATGRRVEPYPLHVSPVQNLEPLDARCRKKREEVDVLVPQHASAAAPAPGRFGERRRRRVIVEAKAEVAGPELVVI